jgi:hypothetical protein
VEPVRDCGPFSWVDGNVVVDPSSAGAMALSETSRVLVYERGVQTAWWSPTTYRGSPEGPSASLRGAGPSGCCTSGAVPKALAAPCTTSQLSPAPYDGAAFDVAVVVKFEKLTGGRFPGVGVVRDAAMP